jgi:CxxC motif-containing protein
MKELICIVCPKGCHLQVDEEHDYAVTGNSCPRGAEYGKAELTHPTRTVTSTVRCTGGTHPRCPVKTDRAVPKELIFQVMEEINALSVPAPIHVGQVLLEHVCGTQANIVAARDVTVV